MGRWRRAMNSELLASNLSKKVLWFDLANAFLFTFIQLWLKTLTVFYSFKFLVCLNFPLSLLLGFRFNQIRCWFHLSIVDDCVGRTGALWVQTLLSKSIKRAAFLFFNNNIWSRLYFLPLALLYLDILLRWTLIPLIQLDKQTWHKCIYVMLNSTVVKSCRQEFSVKIQP